MPWKIITRDDRYCVVTDDDREETVACHDTEAEAKAQLRALYANEEMGADLAVTFDDDEVVATFRADVEKRTISGLLVPYGPVAKSGGSRWRFGPRSLRWANVSRVKLNMNHERREAIGVAVRLQEGPAGVDGTFKVARGPEGDRALSFAEDGVLDGFSIELDFEEGDGWVPDPNEKGVRIVQRGKLAGVALTAFPAFDDARVDRIAAARLGGTMTDERQTDEPTGEEDAAERFEQGLTRLAERVTKSQEETMARFASEFGDTMSAGFRAALENIGDPQGPDVIRASRFGTLKEPPVYRFDGTGPSLVADAQRSIRDNDEEATERLRKFRRQSEDVANLVRSTLVFAPQTTSTASQVIPPGYRPDLYVADLFRERPLIGLASQGTISNAAPFTVPTFGAVTTGSATHTEGTNPSDGSLSFSTRTVTPQAISGRLVLTRELMDSANPAIDQIAFQEMRESYARQTETAVYTLLNGASGAGGTITSGFVPSGAQAATYVGTTGTPPALIAGLRSRLIAYPFARFATPTGAAMGQNAASILATATDSTGRPIFPSIGGTNTSGTLNSVEQGFNIDGLGVRPAWAMTGTAAGDTQILFVNRSDLWVWESPLLTFRFEEKQGPANIELNIFGYFGVHLLRPVGLSGIRIT